MNIFKVGICLTITNNSGSDAKNPITFPFMTKTNTYKKIPSYFRDISSLSVEHYVKVLR